MGKGIMGQGGLHGMGVRERVEEGEPRMDN